MQEGPFPVTPLLQQWRTEGAESVRRFVRATFLRAAPTAATTGTEAKHCSRSKMPGQPTQVRTMSSSASPSIFVPRRRKVAQTDRIADVGGAAQGHRIAEACPAQQTDHIATDAARVGPDRVADTAAAPVDRVADIDRVADDTGNAATTDPLGSQSSATPSIFVPRRRKVAQTDRIGDAGGAAQVHRVAEACPAQQTYHMATHAARVGPDRVADTAAPPVDRVADIDRVADDTGDAATTDPLGSQQDVPPPNPTANISDEDVADGEATDLDLDSVMSWDSNDSISTDEVDEGLGVETLRQWMTLEDLEQDAINKVATHIRPKPLLPPQLDEYTGEDVDSMSGVVFPTIHCAIRGCTWCSATQPCAPNYNKKPNVDTERLEMDAPGQNMLFRCILLSVGTSAKQPCPSLHRLRPHGHS